MTASSIIARIARKQEAARLWTETGLNKSEIGRRVGLSTKCIRALIDREGIARNASFYKIEWTPEMDAELRRLRAAGVGYNRCGDRIGVNGLSVKRRVIDLGLPTVPHGHKLAVVS